MKKKNTLKTSVTSAIKTYLKDLDGEKPANLYETVISEVEKPLLQEIMKHCDNNQSRASAYLGINRGTLRKKLQQHQIDH